MSRRQVHSSLIPDASPKSPDCGNDEDYDDHDDELQYIKPKKESPTRSLPSFRIRFGLMTRKRYCDTRKGPRKPVTMRPEEGLGLTDLPNKVGLVAVKIHCQ